MEKRKICKSELLSLRPERKERKMVSTKLRFEILASAGHKCSLCNQSAKDGVQLHIDHILPVSKGGTNEPDNLRVLCDECNLGRSNYYLD
jgi:5-methylcytosine-specific restriction endonuclease McrA